jgi:hypothetical protein
VALIDVDHAGPIVERGIDDDELAAAVAVELNLQRVAVRQRASEIDGDGLSAEEIDGQGVADDPRSK